MTQPSKPEYPTEEQLCSIYGHQIIWKIRPDFRQRWEKPNEYTTPKEGPSR